MRAAQAEYFSRFGGLWTDRMDAREIVAGKLQDGLIDEDEAGLIDHWIRKGYVILRNAVPAETCDELRQVIAEAWDRGDPRLQIFPPGSSAPLPPTDDAPRDRMRAVDVYVSFDAARRILLSPAIVRFLTVIFDRPPLLFQSLSFEKGSEQGMHQDTAYVVTSSPMELAAAWIALEDIRSGSGELMYYEGSHRTPEYYFSGEFKHWSPERDGPEQHEEWGRMLHGHAKELGFTYRTFLPKQGDALIWSADLAHGGSPAKDRTATRRSLVGHYCPADVDPHYFSYLVHRRTTVPYEDAHFSSSHFDLEGAHPVENLAPSTGDRAR